MKTVSEIAKEIGVTPQAVYKRLNNQLKTSLKAHLHKGLKGETLIDDDGEQIIKEAFKPVVKPLNETSPTTVDKQFINSLIDQLKVKDQQLQEKDEQIRQLIQVNQTNQMVLLQAQKQIAATEEKNEMLFNAFTEESAAAPKRSLWAKIFKKER